MPSREQLIDDEARRLWRALRHDAPPTDLHGSALLEAVITAAPAPDYDRLQSQFLRDSQISRPVARA